MTDGKDPAGLNVGVVFPTSEIGNDPKAIRDFAQAAEDLGYHHIVAYDHVLGASKTDRVPPLMGPYDEHDSFHEPLILLGYLAGRTTAIELVTGVLVLPQRQTALVAKQATEIDVLSGGRMRLGVGLGWNHVEYEALGVSFERRGDRLVEQIDVLRRLWTEESVEVSGSFHRIDRASILPRPTRPLPVWMGGTTAAARRRAAKVADGFIFGFSGAAVCKEACEIHELLERDDRDPTSFGLQAMLDFAKGPSVWETEIAQWRSVGGTHISMRITSPPALATAASRAYAPADHIRRLEEFMRAVQ